MTYDALREVIDEVVRGYQAALPHVDPHITARLGLGLAAAICDEALTDGLPSERRVAEIVAHWLARAEVAPTSTIASPPGLAPAQFEGLLRYLGKAVEGERNATLYWTACRVGEMVADGRIGNAAAAVDLLADVALSTGLGHREVYGTIRSGLGQSGVTA